MISTPSEPHAEDGDDAAAEVAEAPAGSGPSPARSRPSRLRKRAQSGVALFFALVIVGAGYSFAAPGSSADDGAQAAAQDSEQVAAGEDLFRLNCQTCHGPNLQGVTDRGPSLIGVGEAAVYFQVATGRMPLARQEAQAVRKTPKFDEKQIEALAAYVQSIGGGPTVPDVTEGDLADADLAYGGELFRLNCASCHSTAGAGGALSSGKHAPDLYEATPKEIYAAMLTGPENMPAFGENQLTPEDKLAITAYVDTLQRAQDPGGAGIGRTGPVPEGLVIWLVGIGVLLIGTVWLAGKS